ncbi:hypothetical protein [Paraflavitalea speifideaquila]|uniref:hypothetical protein n=1 Tax=Paraflavitalea speifideaquila TaxID=3076558 RepID=UPI0028E5AAE3|nr:hypothetical protein [Paraflavitalea speifideiaquila]
MHTSVFLRYIIYLLAFIITGTNAWGQAANTDKFPPALTPEMVKQYAAIFEVMLEIKLGKEQFDRLHKGLNEYWIKKDAAAIHRVMDNLGYFGKQDELESLRSSSQLVIVESMRRENKDAVSILLIEMYDKAHPDRIAATRARSFADLVGTWKDPMVCWPKKTRSAAGGRFFYQQWFHHHPRQRAVHTYPCQQPLQWQLLPVGWYNRKREAYHRWRPAGVRYSIWLQHYTGWLPPFRQPANKDKTTQRKLPWALRPNPDSQALTLCWNTGASTAICYEKQ